MVNISNFMCVDWIAYILLDVDWIDIESECWWIVLKLVELYVIVDKWWIENEYWWCDCDVNWLLRNDELKWMWKTWFGNMIDFVFVVKNDVIMEDVELWNEILNDVDDERMRWAIKIVELKFENVDWIVCVWW